MSKHGSARAVLAGAAIIALAGCGVPSATAPDIPSQTGPSQTGQSQAGATSRPSSAAPVSSGRQSATSATSGRQREISQSFVTANSIPFPVAVGNTWVYQTTAVGQTGQTTNRIVAAGAVPAGYQVTMPSTTNITGAAAAVQSVYLFYRDGTVGIPVPPLNGVSVVGGGIRWPDAAALASGRAYHSVLRLRVNQTGQYEDASVTVQGAGTTSVGVPAGTYQASVVDTIIVAKAMTVAVTTWIAQGIGPVRTEVVIRAAGTTELTTNQLLSFTRVAVQIGS